MNLEATARDLLAIAREIRAGELSTEDGAAMAAQIAAALEAYSHEIQGGDA